MAADDQRRAAWRELFETHAALTQLLETELRAEVGLPMTRYDILLHLAEARRPMRMHELAAAVVISKSGLTRLVDRMEDEGLLVRESIPGDRRSTAIRLTAAGTRRFEQARAVHRRGIREHFSRHLSEDEAKLLRDVLGRLRG